MAKNNPNARCKVWSIVSSSCTCVLILVDECGLEKRFGLWSTTTYPLVGGGFVISDDKTTAKVSEDSNFTQEDIDALTCECRRATIDDPYFVSIEASFVDCQEEVSEGLPVRLICNDTQDLEIACAEDGQLIYINLNVSPPLAYYFDGTPYTGIITSCDVEYKWIERCFQEPDGSPVTQVICWEVKDITTTQVIWVLSDGTITDSEPADLTSCDDVCDPFVADYIGAAATANSEPFNKINVYNPNDCCMVTVTTSAGDFIVLAKTNKCLEFECNLDPDIQMTSEDPDCIAKIITTIQRTK